MFNKNDPLIQSVKEIMKENEFRRQVEAKLCEELGIYSRKELPHEHQKNYDALLEQRISEALHPNQQKLDVHEPEKDKLTAQDFKMLRAKKTMKEEEQLDEKAVSKAQHRFFGLVRAIQKGKAEGSEKAEKAAKEMSATEVRKFAKTKEKGLPEKKSKESMT